MIASAWELGDNRPGHERLEQSDFPELRVAGCRAPRGAFAMRCVQWVSTCGSTRVSCVGARRGMRRSAGRSRNARCSCRSSRPTPRRARRVIFGWSGNSPSTARTSSSTTSAFLLPVVIDATLEAIARVPEKFREVQWTHLPAGETSSAFAEQVQRLLSGDHVPPPVAAPREAAGSRHGEAQPRTAVDRGAAVREPQPRRGRRVLLGRPRRRAAQRVGEDPRAARGGALVGVHVQGQGGDGRRGGPGAECRHGAGRQRAQGWQPDCGSRCSW